MPGSSKVNAIIRTLIISDFFVFFGVGLLAPIYAVFVLTNIENNIEVIGFAVSIYGITRVVMATPLSRLMDKIRGENDEYLFMIGGTFIISCVPLAYIFASEPWHIYVIQFVNAIAHSMAIPAWRILFTKHIDKRVVGLEWSLEDVSVGVATASSASVGALIVGKYGFNVLFIVISSFGFVGTAILLIFHKYKRSVIMQIFHTKGEQAPLKIDTLK